MSVNKVNLWKHTDMGPSNTFKAYKSTEDKFVNDNVDSKRQQIQQRPHRKWSLPKSS